MSERSQGLHPLYLRPSGWNALLPARAPKTSIPAARRFKTVVIGGGYTGLAVARRLAQLEPSDTVLVAEAGTIGEGASARNSGFLSRLPNRPMAHGQDSAAQAAHRQLRIYAEGHRWLKELVAAHDIDCDWDEQAPRISAAATEEGEASLRKTSGGYDRLSIPCTRLDRAQLAGRVGTDYYRFGYSTSSNAFVQPAALIRGLADSLPGNVDLVERLVVTRIETGATHEVHTDQGVFECDRVMVANNGFARQLGLLRDRLITIYTYAGLTGKLPDDELRKLGAEPAWGILPAHRLGTTLRKTRDGRFMVRSGYSYEKELAADAVTEMLTSRYRNRYPGMKSHRFEYAWGGCTALTLNGGLFFGKLADGLYASVGCNGAGVLRGSIQGRLLAEMACGIDSDLLSDELKLKGPSWIPPEPIRKIGVLSVLAYERSKAGLEQ